MIQLLKRNKSKEKTIETDFILSHNLYARAEVPPTDKVILKKKVSLLIFFLKVGLWLGANVMLEYSLEQADDLLSKNLKQANQSMEQTDNDLDFLKYFKLN